MRYMRRIIQVTMIVFVFVLWAPVSYACWCSKPDVKEAFVKARVVFVGEVVAVVPPHGTDPNTRFGDGAYAVKFKVETAWKKVFLTEASVFIRMDSCFRLPAVPQKGEKYLVYAEPVYPDDPFRTEMMTHGCTRTVPLSATSAAADVRALDTFLLMFTPRRKPVFNPLPFDFEVFY